MTENPFVIETELPKEPGNSRSLETTITLDERLGTDVIAIPVGGSLHLDLLLESVMDGVLVSGTVEGALEGDCVRCLEPLNQDLEVMVTELYAYPDMVEEHTDEEDADPIPVVDDGTVDLTEMIVDAVVADLPFNPVCNDDCLGLCQECGFNLNEDPSHEHEAPTDPRWAALGHLSSKNE